MRNDKKVIIITHNKLPDLDAGAVRLMSFLKMFVSLGYYVQAISLGDFSESYDYYSFVSLGARSHSRFKRLLARLIFGLRVSRILKKNPFDVCLYTQVNLSTQKIIKKYCKKYNAKLFYDCVEWFTPDEFKLGFLSPSYRNNIRYNTKIVNKGHIVISISKYLHNYFGSKGIKTVYIPAILDEKDYERYEKEKAVSDSAVSFLYAGSPGKKDQLDIIIRAFLMLDDYYYSRYKFYILGCTEESFFDSYPYLGPAYQAKKHNIVFMGRVGRKEVLDTYKSCDFSVFLRNRNKLFAKAGFPTKFAESMMMCTPVITNLSSNLGDYLTDGKNGFVVNDNSSEALKLVIEKTMSLGHEKIMNMFMEAKKTARNFFDYHLYSQQLFDALK